jgi:hypothetical protein
LWKKQVMQAIKLIGQFSLLSATTVVVVAGGASSSYAGTFKGTYSFTNGSTAATVTGDPILFSSFASSGVAGSVLDLPGTNNDGYLGAGWSTSPNPSNTYFEFTVNPAGLPATFTDFGFKSQRVARGPRRWQLQASVGGGAFVNLASGNLSGNASVNQSLGSQLSGVTQQVVFRLYGFNAPGNGLLNLWNVDDFYVSGTKVPTPAALPALLGFGMGLWRKRKEQTA